MKFSLNPIPYTLSPILLAGVDEAGRGPCAGPVFAAAAILPDNILSLSWRRDIRDSKKLPPARREELYVHITTHCTFAIAEASVAEIDSINILQASLLAMKRAVESLPVAPEHVLIDGNKAPQLAMRTETVIRGDDQYAAIAAASILAKVARDRRMRELAAQFPHYGWENNMGYGTAQHLEALQKHGPCEHHRRSFAPVRDAMRNAA